MSKPLLNEAERFLIDHWEASRVLEETMEGVRTKYKELFQRIMNEATEAHPKFDAKRCSPTQFWGNGVMGFGRASWPGGEARNFSGFWVENLRIEILTAQDTEPPYASIWVPKKFSLDRDAARIAVSGAAKEILTAEELADSCSEQEEVLLRLPAPTKSQLIHGLTIGDGQEFVKLLVSQIDMMAHFVPVLDKVFRECMRKD